MVRDQDVGSEGRRDDGAAVAWSQGARVVRRQASASLACHRDVKLVLQKIPSLLIGYGGVSASRRQRWGGRPTARRHADAPESSSAPAPRRLQCPLNAIQECAPPRCALPSSGLPALLPVAPGR